MVSFETHLFLDRCQITYLFLSTSSEILSYNTKDSNGSTTKFIDSGNALLSYDGVNKLLYQYSESKEEIASYRLDGSQSSIFSGEDVGSFTVDGRSKVIYYYHKPEAKIRVFDISTKTDSLVNALSDIGGVKDLDMDMINE